MTFDTVKLQYHCALHTVIHHSYHCLLVDCIISNTTRNCNHILSWTHSLNHFSLWTKINLVANKRKILSHYWWAQKGWVLCMAERTVTTFSEGKCEVLEEFPAWHVVCTGMRRATLSAPVKTALFSLSLVFSSTAELRWWLLEDCTATAQIFLYPGWLPKFR